MSMQETIVNTILNISLPTTSHLYQIYQIPIFQIFNMSVFSMLVGILDWQLFHSFFLFNIISLDTVLLLALTLSEVSNSRIIVCKIL